MKIEAVCKAISPTSFAHITMSTKSTPRTQATNKVRSRSNSRLQPTAEPKSRTLGSVSERGTLASTTDLSTIATDEHREDPDLERGADVGDLPFFKQDQFTDVVLQVGGRKLYTCRSLLAYNSPVLARILSSGSSKNKDLDLPEKDYEDVVELLAYIDPRVDYIITEQSAIALLPLAEEYEISSLKKLCEKTIMNSFRALRKGKRQGSIPVEISLEYLHLSDKYEFPSLRNLVTDEFVNNEDPHTTTALMESSLISEHVKLSVLDKKVEKVHFELDKERRERTAIETKMGDYGNPRFRRPLMD